LWLEGIRTKKELRGQGIGKALAFYQLEEALKQHPKVIRLSTAEVNVESIKLIEKMGFSLVHTFTYLEAHNLQETPSSSNIMAAEDPAQLHEAIEQSTFLSESKGLVPWSWIFRELTPRMLASSVARNQWFFCREKNSISGMLLLLPHRYESKQVEISLIDASSSKILNTLFQFAIHRAALHQMKEIAFFSPSERLEKQARNAGFFFPYDFSKVLVYEFIPS
jgi:hypothetical protein